MTSIDSVVRVGVVGCGRVAQQRHLPVIHGLATTDLVAIADVSEETRNALIEQYGLDSAFSDYRELVTSDSVDAVMIAAPTQLHAEVGVAALEAGKHVMIEKPLALSLDDVDALEAAAEGTDRVVAVAMNSRWHRLTREAREVVRGGELGDIGLLRSAFTDDFRLHGDVPDWGMRHEQAGCVLVETAVHHFDLWQFILESGVRDIYAKMAEPMTVNERACVTATMDNGVIVSAMFAEGLKGTNELEIYGQDGRLRVSVYDFDGLDVSPRSEYPGAMGTRARRMKEALSELPGAVRRLKTGGDWAGSYRSEWEHFIDCITNEKAPECGLAEGRRALEVGLAAMASLNQGAPVRISDAPRTIQPYSG
jgi:myo-inositol 2-dehydrogenase / D-chiro-inositol 1-dehydrogenase